MFTFIKKIKSVRYWMKAMDYAANKNFEDAYFNLGMAKKGGMKNLETVLFNAFLAVATNRVEEANACLTDFFSRIFNAEKYNDDEKNYLAAYASWCCNSLPETCSSKSFKKAIYFKSYSLNKVGGAIKRNFPLRVDPNWVD